MKILCCWLLIAILNICPLFGQGQNNIWTFGNAYSLDFNHTPPLLRDSTYVNGVNRDLDNGVTMPWSANKYGEAQAVCDATGKLLFFVKNNVRYSSTVVSPSIFDKDERPIAGTEFLATNDMEFTKPAIVSHPGNKQQYYIFYVRNGGLIYCLFDMTLNGGKGDIVTGYKNILIGSYNAVIGSRMEAVKGCNGIWIVVRHKIYNQYLSYKVDQSGLNIVPVVSETGSQPPLNYWGGGKMALSPDGTKIAAIIPTGGAYNFEGGLEIYDFEKCSGRVKNARMIESYVSVYGICFSPDSKKLYAAYYKLIPGSSYLVDQEVFQFNVGLQTLAAITASKILVLTNPYAFEWSPFCPLTTNLMGNMELGPDGKIYFPNSHPAVCPGTGMGMAIHVIHTPDNLGLFCNPQVNAIWNQFNGMVGNGFDDMPNQLILPPIEQTDTIVGQNRSFSICFKKDTVLKVPLESQCYKWNTGSTDSTTTISQSGTYWIRYYKDCRVYVDTVHISFVPLPEVRLMQFGCPGQISFEADNKNGISTYIYTLFDAHGKIVDAEQTSNRFVVNNLDQGEYTLKVGTEEGCDTLMKVTLTNYPLPDILVSPDKVLIPYGESVTLQAEGARFYTWSPARDLDQSSEPIVLASPDISMQFRVIGINDYGCADTAYALVEVGQDKRMVMPNAFTPNGDGKNDVFAIPFNAYQSIRKFEIFNRFGQLVYQDTGSNKGWDGTCNGKPCDQGVYYYHILLDYTDGKQNIIKGDITLIR